MNLPLRATRILLASLCIVLALPVMAHSAGGDFRLLASSDRSITFEVEVPGAEIVPAADGSVRIRLDGYGSFSPPGAPEIPGRSFRVALPPDGGFQIDSSVLEWENLGRIRLARVFGERLLRGEDGIPITERFMPENPWSEGYAPDIVGAGTASFMGRQRVLPVRVNPLVIDGEEARLARRIRITVSFTGAGAPPVGTAVKPPSTGAWDRLYRDLLVNPGDIGRFRKPLTDVAVQRSSMQADRRLKLLIPETGLFAVRADSLIDAGLSPGLSTGMIALKKYYYDEGETGLRREVDVPVIVLEDDGGAPTILDGADRIVFFAFGLRDDADAGDAHALYTNDNVLWLEEGVAGAVMSAGEPLAQGAGDPLPSYGAKIIEREDTMYWKNAKPGSRDFYFAIPAAPSLVSYPITVDEPAPDGSFTLVIEVQGRNALSTGDNLTFAVRNSTGTHVLGTRTIRTKERFTYNLDGNPMSWLVDGENELVISCTRDYVYLIDDYRLEYEAEYVARDDYLEFEVDAGATDRTVEITGFSTNSGTLIEITDPWAPIHYELGPSNFTGGSPPYTLSLEMPASGERRFIATVGEKWDSFPIKRVRLDSDSDLRAQTGPFTAMIISHRSFVAGLAEYASWRAGQGYRILLTDVEDVYDEFNGGLPSSDAIKRFIKYGHDHWGVEFVLLVGDAQEDHKQLYYDPLPYRGSPTDFVPSRSICFAVPDPGYDDEVVSSDNWYSFLDPGEVAAVPAEGADGASLQLYGYPDVFVGRFPVGSDIELVALLTKIMRFEDPDIDDTWRRNIILLADDAWSGSTDVYKYEPHELAFEQSIGRTAGDIEESLPNGFDITTVRLSHWTDGAHEIGEEGPAVYSEAEDSTRTYCTPYLIRHLNEGCLLFSFQGHAGRANLTKEAPFATMSQYSDQDSLRSRLPLVFTGFGCHISEFARLSELSRQLEGDNGDCFSEQLLFKPGSGAVGTYASSAFEYLDQNAVYCERLHREIFQSPPADSVPPENEYTGAHWILAEAITKALIEHLDATWYGFDQALRYTILGDPMLDIDPGPPVMELEADWGAGWMEIDPESMRAQNGTNDCRLRFTTSDVIALGEISLEVNGEDWTDSLVITPLSDQNETYARSYAAEMDYTITLEDDGSIVYHVFTPEGREAGLFEVAIETGMRFFYNEYIEILPGVQSPPTGDFKLVVDFPAFISQEPALRIDGIEQDEIHFTVPNQQDSLLWQAEFPRTFSAGSHVLTVRVGEFMKDFAFEVTGGELVAQTFNFPNPFTDGTNIVYTLNLPVDSGRIEIYNVSGVLVRALDIPRFKLDAATYANPHSVYWDGRDMAGDLVANGTYIYVIRIERAGASFDISGKSVRLR